MKCGDCKFYDSYSQVCGTCKRYPPKLTYTGIGHGIGITSESMQPDTALDNFCGEFKERKNNEAI